MTELERFKVKNQHRLQYMAKQQPPKWVWECVKVAWKWILKNYPNFRGYLLPPFRFSYQARFDKCQWGNSRYFKGNFYIRLHKRKTGNWLTYEMKTIGKFADVKAKKQERMTLALVHELTHYVQYLQNRTLSEVETTKNEIAFAKENYYHLYKQLTPIKD